MADVQVGGRYRLSFTGDVTSSKGDVSAVFPLPLSLDMSVS